MSITIRNRIYISFLILVSIFIINGIITMLTMHNNKKLSQHISMVIDPVTQGLIDFNRMIVESKMYSTNWVFLRANQEDKNALLAIHQAGYPELKAKLNLYTSQLSDTSVKADLANVFVGFEKMQTSQKVIMNALKKFDDYDDPFIRLEMEEKVEDEIVPQTAALVNKLNLIVRTEQSLRMEANQRLEKSSVMLSRLMLILAVGVIIIGIILAVYMTRIIINPIHRIRQLVIDLGLGKISKIKYKNNNNEIGRMVESVNNLAQNLEASSAFANEIGKRNYNSSYQPLSEHDTLGKALVTMRDNLQKSDYRINEAQRIAKLGSWELDLLTNETNWSEQFYHLLGYQPKEVKADFKIFVEMVLEEDRPQFKALKFDQFKKDSSIAITCKILTATNEVRDLSIQGHGEFNEKNERIRLIGIIQDITEQKRFEDTLIKNNSDLKKTNMELDKFVYSVSHDLRAPLSSMLGIVQLTEEDVEDKYVKENLGHVKGSILKLDGFIQDILAYSRNARTDVKRTPIHFDRMLGDIKNNLKYMGGSNNQVSILTQIHQTGEFLSDESRLSIVLNNLISNGIRYSNANEANPFVEVSVFANQYEVQIRIEDNGIGIRKDLQEKVFDMFYRVSENSVGSGLGLYIVKEAVEKLGGTIAIESEPGKGTTFTIKIQAS